MDNACCYFHPAVVLDVTGNIMPGLDWGDDLEFTNHRRRALTSLVAKLKGEDAIEVNLIKLGHYCTKFRLCLDRGTSAPLFLDLWLIPVRASFFWGKPHQEVADLIQVVERRRLTGLAHLRWVAPLNGGLR